MNEELHLQALELMGDSVVLDTHSHFLLNGHYLNKNFNKRHKPPWLWNPLRNSIDLPRLREGRVSCSTCTIYVPPPPLRLSSWASCQRNLDTLDKLVAKAPDELVKTDCVRDIRAAKAGGLLALLPAVEGGHVIGRKLERVGSLRERGVRILTLVHFIANRLGDAHGGPQVHRGISGFGREVIAACQDQGLVVDLAHLSDRGFDQTLEALRLPPMVTHSALRDGRSSQRFLTPEQLDRIAERDGGVGVILWPWYIKRGSVFGGVDLVVDTYARMADRIGPEHLMIGSDMDGYTWNPRGLREVSDLPVLTAALLEKGFSEEDVQGILGGNALRILEAWERG
jgi:membrane dipeptidase